MVLVYSIYSTSYIDFTLQSFSQAVTGAALSSQGMSWSANTQRVHLSFFSPLETSK